MSDRPAYRTDLTDDQWTRIAPFVAQKDGGRNIKHSRREIVNAVFYLNRTGCQWRNLPHDFPPWNSVFRYFRTWARDGTWSRIHNALREETRKFEGRNPEPSAGSLDSQSVKASETSGEIGFDAGKRIKGTKRHILVDVIGLIIALVVTSADVQDRDGGKMVLAKAGAQTKRLELVWADSAYSGKFEAWVAHEYGWRVQIIAKQEGQRGFVVLPRRWVVERTFAWVGRNRRMSKEYERTTTSSEAMMHVAMINLMTRRLDCSEEGCARKKANRYSDRTRPTTWANGENRSDIKQVTS